MLDLVRWMRSYNQDPGHARKVKFYGIDMQSPERAFAVARTYLAGRSDKDRVWAEKELSPPAEKNYASASLGLPEAYLGLAEKMSIRFKEMAGHRHEEEAFQVAERCVEVLRQGCRLALAGTMAGAVRDSYMAENVLWILAHEGPDSKAVLSAHNGHVSFAPEALDGAASLGAHLRRKLGRRLVVCGFAFNEGDYLAHGATGLKAFHAGKAQPGSLDHGLAKCGLTEYALDLRATNERPLPAWFGQRRPARSIGAVSWGCQAFSYQILVPADHFDILVFQRTIHPSSLLLEGL
jgi:erythromycin esterase